MKISQHISIQSIPCIVCDRAGSEIEIAFVHLLRRMLVLNDVAENIQVLTIAEQHIGEHAFRIGEQGFRTGIRRILWSFIEIRKVPGTSSERLLPG